MSSMQHYPKETDQKRISTVFFDVGHTLLRPGISEAQVFTEAAADEGVYLDPRAVERHMPRVYEFYEELYEKDDSFWSDDRRANDIWIQMYEYLCQLAEVKHNVNAIAQRVNERYSTAESWEPFNDVLPTLDALKGLGIKMGLISNWSMSLPAVINGLCMGHYFSTIIASATVKMHKPQPEIFQLALKQLDVSPSESMHVGDHLYADVGGARSVGITAVLIDREKNGHDGDFHAIHDLKQLVGLVQATQSF